MKMPCDRVGRTAFAYVWARESGTLRPSMYRTFKELALRGTAEGDDRRITLSMERRLATPRRASHGTRPFRANGLQTSACWTMTVPIVIGGSPLL